MALVFPRDLTDLVRWSAPSIKLMFRQEMSRRQGGTTQAKDMGEPLWVADWTSVPLPLADADAVVAQFSSLRGSVNPFYLYPFTRSRPRAASASQALTGVTVLSVRSDNAALQLSGLPADFEMSAGDFLSIETSAGGREFHRVVVGGGASSGGVSPELEVEHYVRPSVVESAAVTLVKPLVEMRLDPGSLDDPFAGLGHRRIVFKATQVVR